MLGRGSWIRTNDLQYPKLPRYQAALYPDLLGSDVDTTPEPQPTRRKASPSAAVEQRMGHPVAGRDPVFLRRAGNHLQHALGEPARRDDFGRQRLGILRDPQDAAVGANKDHVERDVG